MELARSIFIEQQVQNCGQTAKLSPFDRSSRQIRKQRKLFRQRWNGHCLGHENHGTQKYMHARLFTSA